MKNIYGEDIELKERTAAAGKGYAAMPGTGPDTETCGTCKHHVVRVLAKNYHKCYLMVEAWTGGAGTDIKVRSLACSEWVAK